MRQTTTLEHFQSDPIQCYHEALTPVSSYSADSIQQHHKCLHGTAVVNSRSITGRSHESVTHSAQRCHGTIVCLSMAEPGGHTTQDFPLPRLTTHGQHRCYTMAVSAQNISGRQTLCRHRLQHNGPQAAQPYSTSWFLLIALIAAHCWIHTDTLNMRIRVVSMNLEMDHTGHVLERRQS